VLTLQNHAGAQWAGDDDHVLLGMRAAGEDASAIIEAGALLIREKQSIRYFDRVLHPHPAITSVWKPVPHLS
jgi:pyruvate/2-oxoglutarate dehydrogenase complex dihydrolipoamide dehydrogenase (E3) component